MSLETVAAIFGMSVDDTVKLIGAGAVAMSTLMTAFGTMMLKLRGARKRAFTKIRLIEDILIQEELERTGGAPLTGLYLEMKDKQRPDSDAKDGYDDTHQA